MNETKYLMDNNAWGFIGAERRSSDFVQTQCRVTEDVAYEARYTPRSRLLASITEPVNPSILRKLGEVMRTVPVGDTSLVDLYANKGAADPVLVATALVLQEQQEPFLFPDEWVIVTRDKAVRVKAQEFCVAVKSPEEFAQIIDQSKF